MDEPDARRVAEAVSACWDPYELVPIVRALADRWPEFPWVDLVTVMGARTLRHELTVPAPHWEFVKSRDPYDEHRAALGLRLARPLGWYLPVDVLAPFRGRWVAATDTEVLFAAGTASEVTAWMQARADSLRIHTYRVPDDRPADREPSP